MRDKRKNTEYFNAYLEEQHLRTKEKETKLRESKGDKEKQQRILVSLTNYEIDILKAEFSNGASAEQIKKLLKTIMDIVKDYKKITHEDIVILLSLAILLDMGKETKKFTEVNKNKITEDRLLNCLFSYIEKGEPDWDESISIRKEYSELDKVFKSNEKENALLHYLEDWYETRKEYAWYDSHLRDSDTYCGYWSFESAAIAKILNVDDKKLKKNEFYPVL
jgi:hypothetical protein